MSTGSTVKCLDCKLDWTGKNPWIINNSKLVKTYVFNYKYISNLQNYWALGNFQVEEGSNLSIALDDNSM